MIDFLGFDFYEKFYTNRTALKTFRYPLVEDHLYRYDWISKKVTGKVLDVACGSGWGTQYIIKNAKLKVASILGIDINPKAYSKAKSLKIPNLEFSTINLLSGDFPKDKFDTIVAFEIIEHFDSKDVNVFLQNLKKFGSSKTKYYFSTPNHKSFSPLGIKWLPYHPVEYTEESLIELLEINGFKVENIYYQRLLIKPLHKILSYLLLFPLYFLKNRTIENKIVKVLYGLLNRAELFISKSYFCTIEIKRISNLVYPKYFIIKCSKP